MSAAPVPPDTSEVAPADPRCDPRRVLDRLPDFPLRPAGPAARGLLARGLTRYADAAAWVWRLPYGRNGARDDLAVLAEARGTCSTKHALLARLAQEHGVDVELVLAIYLMDGDNTRGVAEVLAARGLRAVPEAHCLLRWRGAWIDLTRAGATGPVPEFLYEETIAPGDIAARKVEVHRRFLAAWIAEHLPGSTLEQVWSAREACIAALAV